MRPSISTGEQQDVVTGERLLACDVIWSGIIDMVSKRPAKRKGETKHVYRNRCGTWELRRTLAYEFMTGQTPIAQYWFEMAGIEPVEGNADEVTAYLRENITKCGIKKLGVPL